MTKLSQLIWAFMAFLVLALGSIGPSWCAAPGEWLDSTSSAPEASAPLPPRESSLPLPPEAPPAPSPASTPKAATATGTVRWFNAQKGYGYIQPDAGGDDIFVHISAVERAGIDTLRAGQRLGFQVDQGLGGGAAAVDLHPLPGTSPPDNPSRSTPAEGSSRPPPPKASPHPPRSDTAARLPPPRDPSPALEPAESPLAAQARDFIDSYWEEVGSRSDRLFYYLKSIYSPVVNYYGKLTPRESIIKDKYNFVRRWPDRQTWPSPGAESPEVTCNEAKAECEIAGMRDFDAASANRGAHSAGTVRYSYKVRFVDGSAQIVAEDSKVVSRSDAVLARDVSSRSETA